MTEQTPNTTGEGQLQTPTPEVTETPNTALGEGIEPVENPAEEDPQGGEPKEEPEKKEGEEEDKGKGNEGKKDDNELFGKPEAYDYKEVKLPEGMQLNEEMTKNFNEYADKLNLSQKRKITSSKSSRTFRKLLDYFRKNDYILASSSRRNGI